MSRFSGKCDCYDSLVCISRYTEDELINNVKIYVGNEEEPLHIESYKDLIPYYPYIIGSACYNNVERKAVIHLSSESFVDREEREFLESYFKDVLREYNRCKRNKVEFDVEATVDKVSWWTNKDIIREIASRVKQYGRKANTYGIHMPMHEIYRKELVKEMVANGLKPHEWGYERFDTEVDE